VTKRTLACEELQSFLDYDALSGEFKRKVAFGKHAAGDPIGHPNTGGYIQIAVAGKVYLAHRLAWLYVHGRWPTDCIDHIDGNPANNVLANLRECSRSENQQNRKINTNARHGVRGVYLCKKSGKWGASIKRNCKSHYLGVFPTKEEAAAAYLAAKASLHDFQPVPREIS
jgi:hypothetical protein